MTNSPAYLWYPRDVFDSERVEDLSPAEECWYRRALDRSWGDEGISSDPVKAAKRIGKKCTVKAAEMILKVFFVPKRNDATKMVNPRQEKERKKLFEKSKQKSAAGKKGMAKRWKQRSKSDNTVITPLPVCYNISSSISSSISKEEEKTPNGVQKTQPAAEIRTESSRTAKKSATRLPADFAITPERWAWLSENTPDLHDPHGAHAEWVEYWTNETSKRAMKLDWNLAWQKGMRLARKWQGEKNDNGNCNNNTGTFQDQRAARARLSAANTAAIRERVEARDRGLSRPSIPSRGRELQPVEPDADR